MHGPFMARGGPLQEELVLAEPADKRQAIAAAFVQSCNLGACHALAAGNAGSCLQKLLRAQRVLGIPEIWTDGDVRECLLALTLNNMACERQHKSELLDARRYLQDAIRIERRIENVTPGLVANPAETFCNLGVVLSRMGEHQFAAEAFLTAVAIMRGLRRTHDPRGGPHSLSSVAVVLHNLGAEFEHLCDWTHALDAHAASVAAIQEEAAALALQLNVDKSRLAANQALAARANAALRDVQRRVLNERRISHFAKRQASSQVTDACSASRAGGHASGATLTTRGSHRPIPVSSCSQLLPEITVRGNTHLTTNSLAGASRLSALERVRGDSRWSMRRQFGKSAVAEEAVSRSRAATFVHHRRNHPRSLQNMPRTLAKTSSTFAQDEGDTVLAASISYCTAGHTALCLTRHEEVVQPMKVPHNCPGKRALNNRQTPHASTSAKPRVSGQRGRHKMTPALMSAAAKPSPTLSLPSLHGESSVPSSSPPSSSFAAKSAQGGGGYFCPAPRSSLERIRRSRTQIPTAVSTKRTEMHLTTPSIRPSQVGSAGNSVWIVESPRAARLTTLADTPPPRHFRAFRDREIAQLRVCSQSVQGCDSAMMEHEPLKARRVAFWGRRPSPSPPAAASSETHSSSKQLKRQIQGALATADDAFRKPRSPVAASENAGAGNASLEDLLEEYEATGRTRRYLLAGGCQVQGRQGKVRKNTVRNFTLGSGCVQ